MKEHHIATRFDYPIVSKKVINAKGTSTGVYKGIFIERSFSYERPIGSIPGWGRW